MSRLPLVEPETAKGAAAETLAAAREALGSVPNMTQAMANSPAVLRGYLGFTGALAEGALPVALAARVALLTAQYDGCDYCLSAGMYAAVHEAGLDDAEANRARYGQAVDPAAEAALTLAKALLRTRGDIGPRDLAGARAAGLSDAEIAEVLAHIALNVFTNYFNRVAATAIDWPIVRH